MHKIIYKYAKLRKIKTKAIAVIWTRLLESFWKKCTVKISVLTLLLFVSTVTFSCFYLLFVRFWYLFSFQKLQTNNFNIKILKKSIFKQSLSPLLNNFNFTPYSNQQQTKHSTRFKKSLASDCNWTWTHNHLFGQMVECSFTN